MKAALSYWQLAFGYGMLFDDCLAIHKRDDVETWRMMNVKLRTRIAGIRRELSACACNAGVENAVPQNLHSAVDMSKKHSSHSIPLRNQYLMKYIAIQQEH